MHPRSRAQWEKVARTSIQVKRRLPASPARWLYGLFRAHPGETCFVVTVIPEERQSLTNLPPASGRQVHTTSPSASRALISRTVSVHRIFTHVRDDREAPLVSGKTDGYITRKILSEKAKFTSLYQKYFRYGSCLVGQISDLIPGAGQPVRPEMLVTISGPRPSGCRRDRGLSARARKPPCRPCSSPRRCRRRTRPA